MLVAKRLALLSIAILPIVAGCQAVRPAPMTRPVIPRIEASSGWRLSEGCRVSQYGVLTDPDCDLLTGEGIAIQVNRVRVLNLQPGQDNRPAIGIQLQPDQGDWEFSSPFVALLLGGRTYTAEIDEALVYAKGDRPGVPEKLGPDRQRYDLPPGEKRFFRLRFPVDQTGLANGFELRVTGLHKGNEAVAVPVMKFEPNTSTR